jgi:hypothetical protein
MTESATPLDSVFVPYRLLYLNGFEPQFGSGRRDALKALSDVELA